MKLALCCALVLFVCPSRAAAQGEAGITTRVSVTPNNVGAGQAIARSPSISGDGRYVAFASEASNYVIGDTNAAEDVFVRDRQTAQTTRISVTSNGRQLKGHSSDPSMSADGRFVTFRSSSGGVVSFDTNGADDIFLHDRQTGATTRVSISTSGQQANGASTAPALSGDGRYVVFQSRASNLVPGDTNSATDILIRDRQTNETKRVSVNSLGQQANSASSLPSVSGDGRFVAFLSAATNLVSGDTNARADVFVRDIVNGATTRVNVADGAVQANQFSDQPAISADGMVVAFASLASNLVSGDTNGTWDVFVHDRTAAQTTRVTIATSGAQASYPGGTPPEHRGSPSLSRDGRFVVFVSRAPNLGPYDSNATADLFVRDRVTGTTTTLLRAGVDGSSFDPAMTLDGREVAFTATGTILNLDGWRQGYSAGVFLTDRLAGTDRVSLSGTRGQATAASSGEPSMDRTARYFTFTSSAANLVSDDTNGVADIFLRDRIAGTTTRVSLGLNGVQLNDQSVQAAISGDGRVLVFQSDATNVVPNDTNGVTDVFVRDLVSGEVVRVSVSTAGAQAELVSYSPAISDDGRYVTFVSPANNLVSNDSGNSYDVFIHDRQLRETSRASAADDGSPGNSTSWQPRVSGDGRFVVFASLATNLPPPRGGYFGIFIRDRQTGRTTRADVAADGTRGAGSVARPTISADGRWIAFSSNAQLVPGDTDSTWDIFIRNRETGEIRRLSVTPGGGLANGGSYEPSLSADGGQVAFVSHASNLVAGDTNDRSDVFLHDLNSGRTVRSTRATASPGAIEPTDTQATNGDSSLPCLSADGRVVAYSSDAVGLVRLDTNGTSDVFVTDRGRW